MYCFSHYCINLSFTFFSLLLLLDHAILAIYYMSNYFYYYFILEFDGRMTPVCGYHGPFAAIFGLHHYIQYYDAHGLEVVGYRELVEKLSELTSFIDVGLSNKIITIHNK